MENLIFLLHFFGGRVGPGRAGPGRVGAGRFSAKMKKKSRQKSPQLPNKTQINQVWEWSNKPFKVSLFNLIKCVKVEKVVSRLAGLIVDRPNI